MPQGPPLGSELFMVVVHDLPERTKDGQLCMYTDDAAAYSVTRNVDEVLDHLNIMAKELNKWCMEDKLTVSNGMTHAMIIQWNASNPRHVNQRL